VFTCTGRYSEYSLLFILAEHSHLLAHVAGRKQARADKRNLFFDKVKKHLEGKLMLVLGIWSFKPNHSGSGA